MDINQIKELLENPQIKELVEAEIKNAVATKEHELEEAKQAIVDAKKKAEKELFVHKKMLVAKATLYEQKLKALKEAEFEAATKKMSSDVFAFINGSVSKLTTAIAEDVKSSTQSAKLTEAFSNAVRLMAPFMNINELANSNTTVVEGYKSKINNLMSEVQDLRGKVLSDDVNTLVVKECAGYPLEKQTIIVNTLKELAPKTLVEAKQHIEKIKHELRAAAEKAVTESTQTTAPVINESVDGAKAKLAKLAEQAKVVAAQTAAKANKGKKEMTAPEDIF